MTEKPKIEKCQNMYVVWSGGCDSTYLLRHWAKWASEKHPLIAISYSSDAINDRKIKMEKKAREKIKKKFEHLPIVYNEVDCKYSGVTNGESGYHQLNMWIGLLLPYMKNDSQIAFGYVEGDCFWQFRHNFDEIVKNMAFMSGIEKISLDYPLREMGKPQIIDKLIELGVYEDVWWCEEPEEDDVMCGKCHPCKTHRIAQFERQLTKELELSKKVGVDK